MAMAAHIASHSAVRKGFLFIFSSLLIFFSIQLVRYHYVLIRFPYPLEYREGAALYTTDLLLKGENPYALKNMPTAINVYGIVYPLFVYPFARLWGATFLVHRSVSAVFLLLSLLLFYVILRRERVGIVYSYSAVLILSASLLARYTPLARPDGLGFFLFLASLFIPYLHGYSPRSLLLSAALGILALYTKAYFVLSIPYLLFYLFVFVSKKKAVFYGATSLVLLLGTAVIVNHVFETYFLNVFFNHMNVATNDLAVLRLQSAWFLTYNAGIVFIFIPYLSLFAFDKMLTASGQRSAVGGLVKKLTARLYVTDYDQPLLKVAFPLSLHCLIWSGMLFYLKLGRHNGNMMTYAYQLITPFLILSTYKLFSAPIKNLRSARSINDHGYVVIMPAVLISLALLYSSAATLKNPAAQVSREAWQRVESITRSYPDILNSPLLVSLLLQQHKTVYDAGQTEYFEHSRYPDFSAPGRWPSNSKSTAQWVNYQDSVKEVVSDQGFDAVIVTPREYSFYLEELSQNYFKTETLEVCMPHAEQCAPLEVWEPRSAK